MAERKYMRAGVLEANALDIQGWVDKIEAALLKKSPSVTFEKDDLLKMRPLLREYIGPGSD
jgi:hypothetical protein